MAWLQDDCIWLDYHYITTNDHTINIVSTLHGKNNAFAFESLIPFLNKSHRPKLTGYTNESQTNLFLTTGWAAINYLLNEKEQSIGGYDCKPLCPIG